MNEEEKTDLVAYLDGELDEEAAQALEARLSKDPAARAELESLRQVYGLLDYLPRPEPSGNFTHRTMERLALGGPLRETGKMPQPGFSWLVPVGWAVAVLLIFGLGWLGAGYLWHRESKEKKPALLPDPDEPWLRTQPKEIQDQWAALAGKARPDFVRKLRAQEEEFKLWMEGQPRILREKYAGLDEKGKTELIRALRAQDRKMKEEWLIASRFWSELQNGAFLPARLEDLPGSVQIYVHEYLKHFLSKEEWARLEKAQGNWPLFPMTLGELADLHPPALPGPHGPRHFDDLPQAVQKMFKGKILIGKGAKLAEGHWPGFGQFVAKMAESREILLPNELWPYSYKGLNQEMKDFVDHLIAKVLSDEEKHEFLNKTPNRWPDYPLAIQRLARIHGLAPPWFSLPPWKEKEKDKWRDKWDLYRLKKAAPEIKS